MIHNRTIKEVRRYDIFKLVVLLFLLILLIFMVLRDESESSTAADGGTTTADGAGSAYPTTGESAPVPGDEAAYPGEPGSAYPMEESDQGQETPEEEAAYPGPAEGGEEPAGQAEGQPQPGSDELIFQSPQEGDVLRSGPVSFSGTGIPGSLVVISAGSSELGQTFVGDDGNWQLDVDIPEGTTTIDAQMTDPTGTITATSSVQVTVVADTGVEEAPETSIAQSDFYAGGSEFSGSGTPGTTVIVVVDGQEMATAEVGPDGSWSAPLDLPAGDRAIVLRTVNQAGAVVNESEPVTITVQEPISPTIDLPIGDVYAYAVPLTGTGQPNSMVLIIANEVPVAETPVNADGTWAAEANLEAGTYNIDVAALDRSGNVIEQIPGLSLPVLPLPGPQLRLNETDTPAFDPILGVIVWSGVADPGTTVAVVANEEVIGTATADENGRWSIDTDLEPGIYNTATAAIDENGDLSAESEPLAVDIQEQPPTLDLPANALSETDTGDPVVSFSAGKITWNGQAAPNSQVVVIINKEVSVSTTADESGNWSAAGELQQGDQELQLGLLDESENITSLSETIALSVAGTQEPVMYPVELDLSNGNATVSGTTKPDTTVQLVVNGAVLATTTSDAEGNYSFDFRLGPGTYEIQVQTLNDEGAVEASSEIETIEAAKPAEGAGTAPAGDVQAFAEEEDAVSAADAAGNFTTLIAGLDAIGLDVQLSDKEEAYTLFAPTDEAFAKLPAEVVDAWNQNPESYADLIFYLVLDGRYTQEELLQAQVLTTAAGTNIGITTDGSNTLVNSVPIAGSIPAGNSIVHAVEEVILPPLGLDIQPPIINVSGVPVFTGTYLTVVGTAEPGKQILLQVSGENFGEIATVDAGGSWLVADDISPGVHAILAYMLDDNGTLMAISQPVSLPVQ